MTRNENFDSLTSEDLNNVRYAAPGEVQTVVDNAASQTGVSPGEDMATVALIPSERYAEGAEIDVKPGVVLDMNGATMTHSGDHNLVFLDNYTRLLNGQFLVDPSTWTSDAIVLDTTRAVEGRYASGFAGSGNTIGTGVQVDADVISLNDTIPISNTAGTGLKLIADGGPISVGNDFRVYVAGLGRGIHAVIQNSGNPLAAFVNHGNWWVDLNANHTQIDQTGDGSGTFSSHIQGSLQNGGDYGIRNQTSALGPTFDGQFWDPFAANVAALAGGDIKVINKTGTNIIPKFFGATDGEAYTVINFQAARFEMADTVNNVGYRFWPVGGNFVVEVNENDGNGWKTGGRWEGTTFNPSAFEGKLRVVPEDLSTNTTGPGGEIAIDDGTNTSSGNFELAVRQGFDGNFVTMGGDTITT